MTFPAHGHYMTLRDIGVALRMRGHDVTFVLCEGSRKTFEEDNLGQLGIRFLSAGRCDLYYREHDDVMRALLQKESLETVSAVLDGVAELSHEMCTAVMPLYAAAARMSTGDTEHRSNGLLPDVLVFDADTFCAQDLAIRFGIPRVARVGTGPRDAFSSPVYVPQYGNAVPVNMSPMQRLGNALSLLLSRLLISPLVLPRLAAKHRFDAAYASVQPSEQHFREAAQALGASPRTLNATEQSVEFSNCSVGFEGRVACGGGTDFASSLTEALVTPPPLYPLDVFQPDVPWDGIPVLYNSHWGLEHARPLHPFEHMIGHTTNFKGEEARPIPPAVAAWLQASPVPVVYVGLGTLGILAPEYLAALAQSMSAADGCRFLWAVPEEQQGALPARDRNFSRNWLATHSGRQSEHAGGLDADVDGKTAVGRLLLVPWVPQLAVLRHAAVSVFWTHGGMNGVAEGTYAHVPMLCMPLFSDQPDNCQRIHDRGMGLRLDRKAIEASVTSVGEALHYMLAHRSKLVEGVAAAWRANVAAGGIPRAVAIVEATAMLGYTESRAPYVPRSLLRPVDASQLPPGWAADARALSVSPPPLHWLQRSNLDLLIVAFIWVVLTWLLLRGCYSWCKGKCRYVR